MTIEINTFKQDTCTAMFRPTTKKSNDGKKYKKPTRPCSSYNVFFQLERAYIIQKQYAVPPDPNDVSFDPVAEGYTGPVLPVRYQGLALPPRFYSSQKLLNGPRRKHRKTHGRISFGELSKLISKHWNEAAFEVKEFCRIVCEIDRRGYDSRMENSTVKQEPQNVPLFKQEESLLSSASTAAAHMHFLRGDTNFKPFHNTYNNNGLLPPRSLNQRHSLTATTSILTPPSVPSPISTASPLEPSLSSSRRPMKKRFRYDDGQSDRSHNTPSPEVRAPIQQGCAAPSLSRRISPSPTTSLSRTITNLQTYSGVERTTTMRPASAWNHARRSDVAPPRLALPPRGNGHVRNSYTTNNGAYAPTSKLYPDGYSSQRRFSADNGSNSEAFTALRPSSSSLSPSLLQGKYGAPQIAASEQQQQPIMPSFQSLVSSASRLLQEDTFAAARVANGRKRKYLSPHTTGALLTPGTATLSPHTSTGAVPAIRDPHRDSVLLEQLKNQVEGETDDLLELLYGVRGESLRSLKRALLRDV